jgi:hypothetical protein
MTRLRVGAMMPLKGGRPSLVAVEVREGPRDSHGRTTFLYEVGHIERITPASVEGTAERLGALVGAVADVSPCMMIDTGSPQGLALYQAVRAQHRSPGVHRPHSYPGTGQRTALFSGFLQSYAAGHIRFAPSLAFRADLDRSLVFYMGTKKGGTASDVELSSEDEGLVVALGLAMTWPRHGAEAAKESFGNLAQTP